MAQALKLLPLKWEMWMASPDSSFGVTHSWFLQVFESDTADGSYLFCLVLALCVLPNNSNNINDNNSDNYLA